jgi:large subunit ribosomal protein L30
MSDKASKTIWIKWVRSGIGFSYRQKRIVRSLGLHRLNEVVERPDTPQVRGLVAKIPHLVSIVAEVPSPAWASIPEYNLRPPEVIPATSAGSPAQETEPVADASSAPAGSEDVTAAEGPTEEGSAPPERGENE